MVYKIGKNFFLFIFKYLCRWEVQGSENVPEKGPVVLISNHLSLWDPMVVGAAVDRRVCFMAKANLFRYPVVAQIIRAWGAFPVKRGYADRSAIKNAVGVLRKGEVLGIFPEGSRSRTGKLRSFMSGAVNFAVKCDAYIVPVGLIGTKNIFSKGWFRSFKVNIGEPISTADFMARYGSKYEKNKIIEELNAEVWNEVARLSGQKR